MKTKTILLICTLLFCIGGGKLYAQTTETEIYITRLSELEAFRDAVNVGTTYEGHTICLTTDIDMTEVSWTPIGSSEGNPFKGHFEGWGHVIRNLSVSGNGDYAGLFGYISGGSVRDVGVEGTIISGGNYVGGICGYLAAGEISSCYSIATVKGKASVGGICGSSGGVVQNCWHKGNVEGTATKDVCAGGLVGCAQIGASLISSYVYSTEVIVPNSSTNSEFGKIVGDWQGTINDDKLYACVYNSEDVIVSGFNASDVVLGSWGGSDSPLPKNVFGATTAQMIDNPNNDNFFWENSSPIQFLNQESAYNNKVWRYVKDNTDTYDYPKLNSFYKNEDFILTFTSSKHWFSLVPNGNYTLPEGVKAYQVTSVVGTSVDGGDAYLQQTPGNIIYEGCPVLLYCESAGEKKFTHTDFNLNNNSDYSYVIWQSGNKLKGSPCSPDNIGVGEDKTSYASDDEDQLLHTYTDYVLSNGAFSIAGHGTIARGKAYLRLPTKSTFANLRFVIQDDDASSIQSVERTVDEEGVWYTLDGRKLEAAPIEKGVYIYNGKKIMIQ